MLIRIKSLYNGRAKRDKTVSGKQSTVYAPVSNFRILNQVSNTADMPYLLIFAEEPNATDICNIVIPDTYGFFAEEPNPVRHIHFKKNNNINTKRLLLNHKNSQQQPF